MTDLNDVFSKDTLTVMRARAEGWERASEHLREKAGIAFTKGQDTEASLLRDMAEELKAKANEGYREWNRQFTRRQAAISSEYISGLRARIEAAEHQDKETFAGIIREVLSLTDYDEDWMADRFDVSRPSVQRWAGGLSSPARTVTKHVYRILLEEL